MTIKTWTSFSKRRNSTKQPTGSGNDKTITLKHPTSIINPVFLLTDYNLADNYCQWGTRYYFIDDIILVNAGQAEYHCSVDSMASWKTGIGTSTEFVARSASSYDTALIDTIYPTKAGVITHTETLTDLDYVGDTGMYVVGIVNKEDTASGSVSYYVLSPSGFANFRKQMFSNFWLEPNSGTFEEAVQKELVNPFQYVVSCNWFPWTTSMGELKNIKFGWWDTADGTPIQAGLLAETYRNWSSGAVTVTLPVHPEAATRGEYLNNAPYTQHTLYCFGFGRIPIDPSYFVNNHSLTLYVYADLFTGIGKLVLLEGNSRRILSMKSQVGVPVQLAQMAQKPSEALISGIGAVAGIATGNFLGAASGVESAVKSMYPTLAITGSNGASIDYDDVPQIISEFRTQTAMDAAQNGRPLCAPAVINTLSGYIKCENADVDLPCTQEERDKIAAYMNGGFFYE